MDIKISPKKERWEISVDIPGDKSIAHRALLISAISIGESLIRNIPWNADVKSTYSCLANLGVNMERLTEQDLLIKGEGLYGLKAPNDFLDAGNSGTTARLLSGILVGQNFNSSIIGDASLMKRPMNRIIIPLKKMGANIESGGENGTLPLFIRGTFTLQGISYNSPVPSAQVKSAVLLASLYAKGKGSYFEPSISRDHTEKMLQARGIKIKKTGNLSEILPGEPLGAEVDIPGDFSTAALLIALGLSLPSAQVTIKKTGINPTRTAFINILKRMGAKINIIDIYEYTDEPQADLEVYSSDLKAVNLQKDDVSVAIDEIPLLAGLAALADGKTTIRGAEELTFKESNRLLTTAAELKRWGVKIKVYRDGMDIWGGRRFSGQEFLTHGDHRIAMLGILLGLNSTTNSVLKNAECLEVSIPNFKQWLEKWQLLSRTK